MKELDEKLCLLKEHISQRKVRIMIIGLGSVGNYLLDYLLSSQDEELEIFVVGREEKRMLVDVNIVRVSSMIRRQNRTTVTIIGGVDLNRTDLIAECIDNCQPDIIVNSSRVYSGLKYGSISWKTIRAYGIWAPLAMKYIKNIMEAYEKTKSDAIVIHTSYSDVAIPWMKSAKKLYPDFGSGNLNHLIPRIQFAAAEQLGISDSWNLDVTYATSHFHDVVISKEGQTEGIEQLLEVTYKGKKLNLDKKALFAACKIEMPVDTKRNMMNASSNFEIIQGILSVVRNGGKIKLHCPGIFGEIGGYPIILDGTKEKICSYLDERFFSIDEMREKNQESIYLDGIEKILDGKLFYTDELVKKVRDMFGVSLKKKVEFSEIEEMAQFLITEIIEKNK